MTGNTLYVVVPCYNEAEALPGTSGVIADKLRALMRAGKVSEDSRALFVDDGSRDGTWALICSLCEQSPIFTGIALSRNRGHQTALLAGLMAARGAADMTISLDADLQDDVDAMDAMVDAFLGGCDIVYGARSRRDSDAFLKRFTAVSYYRLLRALGCEVVFNHADYRLMSARALDALAQYGESDLFLRGIAPMLGFKTATVEYARAERSAGESKYTLKKMLKLASDGVLSLSLAPVRLVMGAGLVMLAAALVLLVIALAGGDARRWRLVAASVWGAGGIVTLALGVVGEYAGRAYLEAKRRPRYIIADTAGLSVRDTEARRDADETR
ncbi:MAG: glycosyltransferase family 2 protein [Oscillospiraceae bacterium]|jgi:glycosyltransferase involved in cell wall biosynthesis|nr:glycosyltransferase family 2 protein [Oscillospiraceae bacterium]